MGNTVLPAKDLFVGTKQVVAAADGSLYQQGTKITASAAQINGLSNVFASPVIDDGDDGVTLTSADQTNAAATVTIPDIGDAADTFVMADTTQTLTNKTLTAPAINGGVLTNVKIADGHEHVTITSSNQTNAAATITIPNCGDASDDFVLEDTAQTVTNKTLTAPVLNQPSIAFTIGAHDYLGAHAPWTLSANELKVMVHKPTNADADVNAIIADTAGIPYIFINGTGKTLTVKGTGAGIAIADGKTHIVMSDGTNVIALAAVSA
jgi:hypothetical protein